MRRLIDANELLRFLENEIDKFESALNKWERDYAKAVRVAAKILRCFPSVDAVEVVHGEWSTIEDDYVGLVALQCSKCNEEYWFEEELPTKSYNYCPNCGAKMDGDGNADV